MSVPIEVAINAAAEIYDRTPFSPNGIKAYRQSVDIQDDRAFVAKLFELIKTSPHFPLPGDFNCGTATPQGNQAIAKATS